MSWRNVIITRRCKLDYKMGYMVVRDKEVQRIYLDEIAVLVLENPAISLTGCLMEALTEKKVKVIFCDSKRNPIAEMVPHHGSHDCSMKIKLQSAWTREMKDLMWQCIIKDKIGKQADFLLELGHARESDMLNEYQAQVESGDATNREGHSAKVYFNALFGMDFNRRIESPINAALNYGYAILLSTVNREVSINGYLTQIGVFHDNRFNPFNLSCDLMEPFRVLIDREVIALKPTEFTSREKHALWQVFSKSVRCGDSQQLVSAAIRFYTRSVLDSMTTGDIQAVRSYKII